MQENLDTLYLKLPRNTEVTPEAAQTFLATLTQINGSGRWSKLFGEHPEPLALEIALLSQQIHFLITASSELTAFINTQLRSNYPLVIIEKGLDPLYQKENIQVTELALAKGNSFPLATYEAFQDIDPLSSILSVLSKGSADEFALIQFALQSTSSSWQSFGQKLAETGGGKKEDGTYAKHPAETVIKEKISYPGMATSIRLAANSKKTLTELKSAFGVLTRSDGNRLSSKKSSLLSSSPLKNLKLRSVSSKDVLNIVELATLWHLPGDKIKTPSIVWGTSVLSEPPENLPVAFGISEEEKQKINFFAKTMFKNQEATFGIKTTDRARHIWAVGKSGTGKSTMIENMVIDDLKKDRAVALIDPHGDSCETLLNYIPSHRINDTVYFNPADRDHPIVINPLEVINREEAELVVSGIMSVFTKIWANVWSARMEYIMRNSLLTLAQTDDATLADVLRILSDKGYRNNILQKINDENLVRFWKNEYDKMPDRLQKEAISPIQNKVGQFVTSPMIRRIIGSPKSSIQLDDIMDGNKIMLCNLSQGRLGEDNSSLLGAVLITKFQQAAMRRVDTPKEDRLPFYLYVDEFQNFATESFIKILSEARKYGLNLMLANQYMAQIPEDVQKAILGNAGTLISFAVGAEDASIIHKEFAEVFAENDLVNLSRFQVAMKLLVDAQTSRPFLANTLPLPASQNQNKEKVIKVSQERWSDHQETGNQQETPPKHPGSPHHSQPAKNYNR